MVMVLRFPSGIRYSILSVLESGCRGVVMNRKRKSLSTILAICICFVGCNSQSDKDESQNELDHPSEIISYPASNPDDYEASVDWNLVWSDEFDGRELDLDNWTRQVLPEPFNGEWQQYFDREENAYVNDGYLILKGIHTSKTHGDNQYTSGRLHTGGKQEWTYGRVAARIQLPYGKGIWPAFWMLGANITEIGGDVPWPACGEIDILELYGTRDAGAVEANLHYEDGGHKMSGAKPFKLGNGIFADQFHVFEMEWDAKQITWYVDGVVYSEVDITSEAMSEFHKPFYLLLNIAIGGEWAGRPDETTPFPSLMYVDWVRVYQRK